MENNNYKYKSTNVLKEWSLKRLKSIPKTFYYGFAFLCLTTVSAGIIGYNFNDSEFAVTASKFKNNESKLLAELHKAKKENKELNEKFKEVEAALTEIEEKDRDIYRTIYNLKVDEDIDSINKEINNYNAEDIDNLLTKIKDEKKSLNEVLRKVSGKDKDFTSLPVIKPVADKYLNRVASGFGTRFHPILKVNKVHNGLDFAASVGTPIYATGDGKVKMAGFNSGYGNVVVIKHGNGYETLYAHMSRIKTSNGKRVKRGDVIGYVGSTGLSTGPHLHYEIHKEGKPVNPVMYFYDDVDPDAFIKIYQNANKSTLSLD